MGARGAIKQQSFCKFGPTYDREAGAFSLLSDRTFNTSFADKSYINGFMGTETVTIGNITVKHQQIGVVQEASWGGDGTSSGLFGLGPPSITNAWPKNASYEAVKKKTAKSIRYDTVFTNMYKQGLVALYFSMAFNRRDEGPGALTLGGLPEAPIRHTGEFGRAPPNDTANEYLFYIIQPDAFSIAGTDVANKAQIVIDSGSPLAILPAAVVDAFYAGYTGDKPKKDRITGQYLMPCDKKRQAPKFGVILNGTTIWFDDKDLMMVASGSLCIGTVQGIPSTASGSAALASLGTAFLENVIAVFDIGAAEMRFANRVR
ncbi:acid protease [Tothia fuscella]|uniref:Acid protease n=1 Tax=Tothia fuscella TaxID=1048955 RepID=A0A9P4NLQ0_9PEZI|nr:acid protease [Tothia fuscella]